MEQRNSVHNFPTPDYLPSYETYAQMLRAMKLEQMKRCTQQGRHQEAGALWTELFNDN